VPGHIGNRHVAHTSSEPALSVRRTVSNGDRRREIRTLKVVCVAA
jgi:hypothetical protein